MADGGGQRLNTGKIEMSQCPASLATAVSMVLMKSSKEYGGKYDKRNWARGMSWSTVYDCLQRHATKWYSGEEVDSETGLNHLYHMACNVAFLIEYIDTYPQGDDRPKGEFRDLAKMAKEFTAAPKEEAPLLDNEPEFMVGGIAYTLVEGKNEEK
jgi:hypothetical protein